MNCNIFVEKIKEKSSFASTKDDFVGSNFSLAASRRCQFGTVTLAVIQRFFPVRYREFKFQFIVLLTPQCRGRRPRRPSGNWNNFRIPRRGIIDIRLVTARNSVSQRRGVEDAAPYKWFFQCNDKHQFTVFSALPRPALPVPDRSIAGRIRWRGLNPWGHPPV